MTPARVLIVEDHAENRALFRTALEHYGHEVLEAGDGQRGLEILRRQRPDLLILDLGLPGIDGLEVARIIHEDPDLRAVPFVVLTADVTEAARRRALELGAREYLTKPILPRELAGAVERHAGGGVLG